MGHENENGEQQQTTEEAIAKGGERESNMALSERGGRLLGNAAAGVRNEWHGEPPRRGLGAGAGTGTGSGPGRTWPAPCSPDTWGEYVST